MDWTSFVLGLLIGWLAELVIDFLYWRKPDSEREMAEQIRLELEQARARVSDLEGELVALKQTNIDLQTQTASEIEDLQGSYRISQDRVATLEAELSQKAAETASEFDRLQGQYRSCQDQVAALEAELAQRASALDEAVAHRSTVIPLDTEPPEPVVPDNLKRIEGIGPKIAELLNMSGIFTFAQLANTAVDALQAILADAGPRFQMANPTTWPQQAQLAADENWEALASLQELLEGGNLPDSLRGDEGEVESQ